jgi:cytochrome oxidase Cu insertion factor (SCO1/SenC/PrrC family)
MKRSVVGRLKRRILIVRLSAWAIPIVTACFGFNSALCFGGGQLGGDRQTNKVARDYSAQQPAGTEQTAAHKYFTDVVLVNQNGEKMRFYSDLLQGKVVIINSFFATCQGSCLPMNRNLERVQQALGDHVGKDVHIVSISVDPAVDTPASLKEYAKKLHARLVFSQRRQTECGFRAE